MQMKKKKKKIKRRIFRNAVDSERHMHEDCAIETQQYTFRMWSSQKRKYSILNWNWKNSANLFSASYEYTWNEINLTLVFFSLTLDEMNYGKNSTGSKTFASAVRSVCFRELNEWCACCVIQKPTVFFSSRPTRCLWVFFSHLCTNTESFHEFFYRLSVCVCVSEWVSAHGTTCFMRRQKSTHEKEGYQFNVTRFVSVFFVRFNWPIEWKHVYVVFRSEYQSKWIELQFEISRNRHIFFARNLSLYRSLTLTLIRH